MVPRKNAPQKNCARKNGPQKNVLQKLFSVKSIDSTTHTKNV